MCCIAPEIIKGAAEGSGSERPAALFVQQLSPLCAVWVLARAPSRFAGKGHPGRYICAWALMEQSANVLHALRRDGGPRPAEVGQALDAVALGASAFAKRSPVAADAAHAHALGVVVGVVVPSRKSSCCVIC